MSDKLQQLEAIRRSGKTNMLVTGAVHRIAHENGFHALVNAIERDEYAELLGELPVDGELDCEVPQ